MQLLPPQSAVLCTRTWPHLWRQRLTMLQSAALAGLGGAGITQGWLNTAAQFGVRSSPIPHTFNSSLPHLIRALLPHYDPLRVLFSCLRVPLPPSNGAQRNCVPNRRQLYQTAG